MKLLSVALYAGLLLTLAGCQPKPAAPEAPAFPPSSNTVGLNTLTTLQPGITELHLEDFFVETSIIDSVQIDEGYTATLAADKKTATIEQVGNASMYTNLRVWCHGHPWVLPLRKARKQEYTMTFDPAGTSYTNVAMAANFNGWQPGTTPFEKKGDLWQATLNLNPGNYHYQLVLDSTWVLDPNNPDSISNNIGGFNSVLKIGGGAQSGCPVLIGESFTDSTITIEAQNGIDGWNVFWDNHYLDHQHVERTETALLVTLPKEALLASSSTLRVFAWNQAGASNDMFVPLQKGQPVLDPALLSRENKHTKSIYFMMVDRFANGNTANNAPVDDPEVEHMANYHGGDLAGITKKINEGFFNDLGCNTVWLSPITQNPETAFIEWPEPHRKFSGYHGYWPISLTKIDHRLGNSAELHGLVDAAHGKNMNVILDFVSNHVHEEYPLYQQHPEWATQLDLPDGRKNIRIWDEHRLTTWFDTFLPTLDHENPEVVKLMSDSAMFWLKEYNLDGFRHDATKHIPQKFWRTLTKKVKAEVAANNKPVFQIGETFGSRELIGDYVGSGQMDGQFDFNLYFDARSTIVSDEPNVNALAESLMESLEFYGYHHLMGNITGNHDMPRFITYAGEGISFEEDAKEAGWNRDVQVENPVGYARLQALHAFIMTIPGIPVVYYGDEFGMPGAGDPDNRRDMQFEGYTQDEANTRERLKTLTNLRNNSMALLYGDIHNIQVTDGGKCLAFERSYFGEHVLVMINMSDRDAGCRVKTDFNKHGGAISTFGGGGLSNRDLIMRDLQPYGVEVLVSKRKE